MNRQSYSLLLILLSPLIWFYLIWRAIKAPEYRGGWLERLGIIKPAYGSVDLVVHCASVGEARAAIPLIQKLIAQYSAKNIVLTTSTPTGKKILCDSFSQNRNADNPESCSDSNPGTNPDTMPTVVYLPIDWLGSCRRFLTALAPKVLVLMETELWPNLLHVCKQKNIKVMVANARLSDKSFKQYARYPKLTQSIFNTIDLIAAQYETDRQHFIGLGMSENKVELVGSIKFDIELSQTLIKQQQMLKNAWAKNRPVWLAASIHPAEFDSILSTHKALLKSIPNLLLIAVPRHPEKFDQLKSQVKAEGFNFINRSEHQQVDKDSLNQIRLDDKVQIVIGDTMGEILLFCGLANVSYVGGSLIERGGHNPLEPIACGSPVFMGQHVYNFSDVCQILQNEQVLDLVENQAALEARLLQLLTDNDLQQSRSQAALKVMQKHAGCVDKMLLQIEQLKG